MSPRSALVERLVKAAGVALLEPEQRWLYNRPGQVAAITRTLRSLGHDERKEFASPKGRHDFLRAALCYLAPLPHEELLVAFGRRRGSARNAGAALRSVHRTIGERDRVAPTSFVMGLIECAMEQDGAEVLLVHNHPANLVKTAIGAVLGGWRPLASDGDRALARRFLERRWDHLLTATRPSSFKWFLVDEGRLREFFLPPMDELLAWLSR